MDRERLDRLMEDPARVRREDISDLKAMTERYPWFSGAHLLLAVGEHAAGDLLFDEQLRTTAAHLPSRAVLFDRVSASAAREEKEVKDIKLTKEERVEGFVAPLVVVPKDLPVTAPEAVVVAAEAPAPPVPVTTVVPEALVIAQPSAPVEAPAPSAPVEATSAEAPTVAEPSAPEVVAEPPAPAVQEEEQPAPPAAPDPLDLQIREAALASSYELTWDFEAELASARATPVTFEGAPIVPAPPTAVEAPITPSTRKRFTAWLDLAPPAEPADLPADLRLDQIAPMPDAEDWLHAEQAQAAVTTDGPSAPTDTKQLIDRFIQQSAAQPVKKAEFFTPQHAAKRSLEDHADLVSETLARIYEKQGNYAKAIAAYERLALKHPDKSAYFAALSEALKARSNR